MIPDTQEEEQKIRRLPTQSRDCDERLKEVIPALCGWITGSQEPFEPVKGV